MDRHSMANILICDDEPEICELLSDWLGTQEHSCTIVENPRLVVSELTKKAYSLVILDYNMPEMNGKDVLTEIRGVFSAAEVPVVFLTGHSAKDIVVEVAKLGVSGFFLKPFDYGAMGKSLPQVLAKKYTVAEVRGLLSKCLVADPSLSKNPGLEIYANRPNALFAGSHLGTKLILASADSTKALRNHNSWTDKELSQTAIVYSLVIGKWHRAWPTFWDR
jgi:CheY-like chemotaxis protein